MSVRTTVRALPTLLRIGFSEAVAYRAEMFVWILSTTMPLIMLVLWTAVAREAPMGRFHETDFVAYFLATFVVRQLTAAWSAWQMSYEIRQGTMSMRLLRPLHPIVAYAMENIAASPMRMALALPVAMIGLYFAGGQKIPNTFGLWALVGVALLGAWMISFLANTAVGCLSFFLESSTKVMEFWLALFFVFSGYLIPVELFPPALRAVANYLPFRYQIGLPVELLTGAHTFAEALPLLLRQWIWVLLLLGVTLTLWARGLKRFGAYGG